MNHGHVALAFDSFTNIETIGGSNLSERRSNLGWGNYNAYKLYYIPQLSANQINTAVNYANNNLLGLAYEGLATVSSSKVNCASLIWKAFNDSGVLTLDYLWGLPYAPKLITESNKTDWVISYNWNYQ